MREQVNGMKHSQNTTNEPLLKHGTKTKMDVFSRILTKEKIIGYFKS